MSYTIYHSAPGALIPQPGRSVNTFPSGLVRVDQTYLGLTSESATHRATLAVGNDMPDGDSSPCIDGLKIYPEIQERRREDGFTEYIASAYGRTAKPGDGSLNADIISISRNYSRNIGTTDNPNIIKWSISEQWLVDNFVESFVIESTTQNSNIEIPLVVNLNRRRLLFKITGSTPGPIYGIPLIWTTSLTGVTRKKYGKFDEIVTTIQSVPSDDPNSFLYDNLI